MRVLDETVVLDRRQLREITMDDEELMQEVLGALLDDTSRQLGLLDAAIRRQDSNVTLRLAHSCKGACANVGANALASALHRLEQEAARQSFDDCVTTFGALTQEFAKLTAEVSAG